MATYDALRDLPLRIDAMETETLALVLGPEFTRKTTVIHLQAGGEEGIGEDVVYDPQAHDGYPDLPLAGEWTLGSFSAHLDTLNLFSSAPQRHAFLDYRRWALESAALDLALRQSARSLADALGRKQRPVTFVVSTRATDLAPLLELYPSLRFKLDPTPAWTDGLIEDLAARDIVDCLDLKGAYVGTPVDNPPDADLYRRVAEAFPGAWIEDPGLTSETDPVLEPHRDRITWDAVIHSWADVESLPFPPRCLNCKPSRFGPLERLFEFYDRCAEAGISLYGGGQLELGPGRGQIQLLASLFHADTPNDVAPSGFNDPALPRDLPTSPLELTVEQGFRAQARG
jgi:hypothetical protein